MTNIPRKNIASHHQAITQILSGKLNSYGTFTLIANVSTTVVDDARVGIDSVILIMPTTADAATENTWITTTKQQFTVNHNNTTSTTRTFKYFVLA